MFYRPASVNYRLSLKALIVGLVATGWCLSAQAATIPQMRGIYGANLGNNLTSALSNNYVDGVQIVEAWSTVEPTEGNFDWSDLDSQVSQVTSYGKKVSLGIQAGIDTPSWVFADGAQAFQYVWDKAPANSSSPAICSVFDIPVPWDPVFMSKWQSLIVALGQHYASNPTIVSVMLYGANSTTIETTLPSSVNEAISYNGVSCTGPNYPANWQAVGYTRTRIENAIYTMQGYFVQAFPQTQLLAALNPGGFPPIDQNGNLLTSQIDSQAPTDLLTYGVNTIGNQYVAGNGGLSQSWVWTLLAGYSAIADIGFQTTLPLGSNLVTAGNFAVGAGASWVELWESDIADSSLQSELASLHQALAP